MSLFFTLTPLHSAPVHDHLLVCLLYAAVRIKLYIMAAITSFALWLLLTPNQHSCSLVMFIPIVAQIVCFENAELNSLMWKKEHLIGFQCFLSWFELHSEEEKRVNLHTRVHAGTVHTLLLPPAHSCSSEYVSHQIKWHWTAVAPRLYIYRARRDPGNN